MTLGAYFDRHSNAAFGIVTTGAGLGLMVFSPLLNELLEHYTWRETLLIVSAILLNLYVCAALMFLARSLAMRSAAEVVVSNGHYTEVGYVAAATEEKRGLGDMDDHGEKYVETKTMTKCVQNKDANTQALVSSTKNSLNTSSETELNKHLIGSKLRRYIPFVAYLFSLLLINTGMSATYLHFPAYISMRDTFKRASMLLSVMGLGNICGRLGFGFFTNKFKPLLIPTFIFSCILTGVTMVLLPYLSRVLIGQCMFSFIFASFGNCFIPLLGPMCIRLMGVENLYTAFGVAGFVSGIGQLIGPVFAG